MVLDDGTAALRFGFFNRLRLTAAASSQQCIMWWWKQQPPHYYKGWDDKAALSSTV